MVTCGKYIMTLLLRENEVTVQDRDSVGVVMILLDLSFILSACGSVVLAVCVMRKKILQARKVALILGYENDSDEDFEKEEKNKQLKPTCITPVKNKINDIGSLSSFTMGKRMIGECKEDDHHTTVHRLMSHHS